MIVRIKKRSDERGSTEIRATESVSYKYEILNDFTMGDINVVLSIDGTLCSVPGIQSIAVFTDNGEILDDSDTVAYDG